MPNDYANIQFSNIVGNAGYAIHYRIPGPPHATATNNWWGTTSSALIDALIFDGHDNPSFGFVNYLPFAAAPITGAPAPLTSEDTTPPVLTVPANISVEATGPSGAVVSFTATASDVVTPAPTVVCSPASGSTFAIGTTMVTCTATDAAGNATTGAFAVHVNSASEQVQALADAVTDVGSGASLSAKVQALQAEIAAGNTTDACDSIKALLNAVRAQTGKKLTLEQAAAITADANRIAAVLGC